MRLTAPIYDQPIFPGIVKIGLAGIVQFLTQVYDLAHKNYCWPLKFMFVGQVGDGPNGSKHSFLTRHCAGLNQRHRPAPIAASVQEPVHDRAELS
jgi:hypothetical protein